MQFAVIVQHVIAFTWNFIYRIRIIMEVSFEKIFGIFKALTPCKTNF